VLAVEAQAAQTELEAAKAELRSAADLTMQAAALTLVGRMRRRERDAAADRVLVVGLLSVRTPSDPPAAWELHSIAMEPLHGHMIDIARDARIPNGGPVWLAFRKALLEDPAARFRGYRAAMASPRPNRRAGAPSPAHAAPMPALSPILWCLPSLRPTSQRASGRSRLSWTMRCRATRTRPGPYAGAAGWAAH